MVTASLGVLRLDNNAGSRSISVYVSDVVAAYATISLNGTAAAGGDTFYIVQNDGLITDFSQVTGSTVMTALGILINGIPIGQVLDKVIHVSTNANRPQLRISVKRGDKLQLLQY